MSFVAPMLRRGGALAAALALISVRTDAAGGDPRKRTEFVRAMKRATAGHRGPDLAKEAKERMYQRLKAGAVPAPPSATKERQQRRLDDGENWNDFGFDPADFSLKYTGCSAVATYSDEMAEDEQSGSVLETKRFVVFRLCPTDTCNNYNSNGCGSNYGEYVLSLEEYLEYFSAYQEEEFEAYCEYCQQCVYYEDYFYGNRKLEDEEQHVCKHYTDCQNYQDTCPQGGDEEEAVDFTEFFECQQFDNGYNAYYVGPHCLDGQTITIGVFSDEYCTEYIGDEVEISDFTGIEFSEDVLAEYTPESCVSCRESDLFYMIIKNDANDEDSITELCENLYIASAKCNKNLYDADDSSYMSYNQAANEQDSCAFIENVVNGAYDSSGNIVLDEGTVSVANLSQTSTGQIVTIVLLAVGSIALAVWACTIHGTMQQQSKQPLMRPEPVERIDSGNSGVMAGRAMATMT